MIVVDTSVVAKFLLHEAGWQAVRTYLMADEPIRTVELMIVETANVLWKQVRRLTITEDQAYALQAHLRRMTGEHVIVVEENGAFIDAALGIACAHGIPISDALFLAEAEARGATLVTADRIQAGVAGERSIPHELL